MGVDLEVVFAATLTAEEAFALPQRLNGAPAVAAACREQSEPGAEPEPWKWQRHRPAITSPSAIVEAWAPGQVPMLGSPGFLYVGSTRIALHPCVKFSGFASDYEGCQAPIRQVCRALAHELGADRVLYLPDSGDWPSELHGLDDVGFDDALARLTAWGPPAAELGALAYARGLRHGYHYADGALRRPDGTPVPKAEIWPGYNWIYSAGITTYHDGTLVPAEELARPTLHGGFAYYVDDFADLA